MEPAGCADHVSPAPAASPQELLAQSYDLSTIRTKLGESAGEYAALANKFHREAEAAVVRDGGGKELQKLGKKQAPMPPPHAHARADAMHTHMHGSAVVSTMARVLSASGDG